MNKIIKPIIFSKLEMANNLKEYINTSSDVKISAELKQIIFNQEDSAVLLIEKKIDFPLEIINVKLYNDEVVKEIFTPLNKI